jgi:hypothetical protein
MYLDDIAAAIRVHIPKDRVPQGDTTDLFRDYAVLLRAKGVGVTLSDVHDAWSTWMARQGGDHASLVPYEHLPDKIREEDRIFATAIQRASLQLGQDRSATEMSDILFPHGPPNADSPQVFELYKLMVQSSEGLVSRRQAVNTFFLTMNGALITASGLIVQSSHGNRLGGVGVCVLAVAGAILCGAWRSLIVSFGQLNRGKFKVINSIERHLPAAIYGAEWEALARGENPKVYRSFTSREIWVPQSLLALHLLTAALALMVLTGCLKVLAGVAA